MCSAVELLAPAGNLKKLKIAIIYGADAVYFAGEDFSLRAGADNFSLSEMEEGIAFAHERGRKCYLTLNIFPHNRDIPAMLDYLEKIKNLDLDGYILSDPGAMVLLKEVIPRAEIHLSTQANMTNYMTAKFWYDQGVRRIVLAREMSLEEIRETADRLPEDMELEAFVHGAMCISYSGRCLLSNFMVQRDANRGACAHPCRWNYTLVESQRPEESYPVMEDDRGTYIMNSKDLSMIDHIPDLLNAGVTSLKIEGRMKSIFYVATIVRAYRHAIDCFQKGQSPKEEIREEVFKVSHRGFTTGFFYEEPDEKAQNYQTGAYIRDYDFIGLVLDYDVSKKMALIEQRNKFSLGDSVEIFGPSESILKQTIETILDEDGQSMEDAPHPQQHLWINVDHPVEKDFMIRKKRPEERTR